MHTKNNPQLCLISLITQKTKQMNITRTQKHTYTQIRMHFTWGHCSNEKHAQAIATKIYTKKCLTNVTPT